MAVIPQYEATKPLDTSPQTMPNIRVSNAPFEAMQGLASTLTNIGQQFQKNEAALKAEGEKNAKFNAQQGWLALNNELDADYATVKNGSTLDDGSDVPVTFGNKYFSPKVTKFIQSLPPDLQDEYTARAHVMESSYGKQTTIDGISRLNDSTQAKVSDYTDRLASDVYANPDAFEGARTAAGDLINSSNLPPTVKKTLKTKVYKALEDAAITSLVENGDFDKARAFARKQHSLVNEKEVTRNPNKVKGVLTPHNWNLQFYKPEDLLGRRQGERWIDAHTAYAADELGKRFFQISGKRVAVNDPHHFDAGPAAGRRRGTTIPAGSPHVSKSQHHVGRAIDFQWQSLTTSEKKAFLETAVEMGFTGVGFYGPGGHIHLDMGSTRTWGKPPEWAAGILARRGKGPKFGGAIPDAIKNPSVAPAGSYGNAWLRKIDVAEKKALDAKKKEITVAQNTTYGDFTGRLWSADKPLTEAEVRQAYDDEALSPKHFNTLMRAMKTKGAGDTSNEVFKTFLDKAEAVKNREDFEELNDEMVDAYANGQIKSTHLDMIKRRAKSAAGLDETQKKNTFIPIFKKRLSVALMPSDSSDKKGQLRRLDGLEKFEARIQEMKPEELTRENLRKIVDDITVDIKAVDKEDTRKNLDMGGYIKKGRYVVEQADLYDAAVRLKKDWEAKKIPADEYTKQVRILKAWQDALKKAQKDKE
jgi:hypothetical protein